MQSCSSGVAGNGRGRSYATWKTENCTSPLFGISLAPILTSPVIIDSLRTFFVTLLLVCCIGETGKHDLKAFRGQTIEKHYIHVN